MQKIIRRSDLKAVTGLSVSTLYTKILAGEFPEPIKLGKRAVGWLESDIAEWQQTRIDATEKAES